MISASSLRRTSRSLIYSLPEGLERRVLFVYYNRRFPRLSPPVTFSEKVNWRILNDRRPLLEWTCDKLAAKDHVTNLSLADLRVPNTIWSGTDINELQSVALPDHWVLKPNHRTGLIYFGHGQANHTELQAVTATWPDTFQSSMLGEWAYSKARPMLFVEELLGPPGAPPPDYKLFVFDGNVAIVEMVNRYSGNEHRLYRPDWSPLDVLYGPQGLAPVAAPPPNLDRMLAIAAQIGQPFDFMRVDLYNMDGVIIFGELTPYPCGGLEPFTPASFDAMLGAHWKLPEL